MASSICARSLHISASIFKMSMPELYCFEATGSPAPIPSSNHRWKIAREEHDVMRSVELPFFSVNNQAPSIRFFNGSVADNPFPILPSDSKVMVGPTK
jgi:hypothetical protein